MKVLFLKDYFSPENCAGISLTNDLLQALADHGFEADVYTPIPCRGIGDEVRREYRLRKKETQCGGKVRIFRYWLPYEKRGTLSRAVRYLLQNGIQLVKGLSAGYDLVFLGSTPPTMGLVGALLKKIRRRPFVYNVQDVFPDSLVTTGIAQEGGLLWKIGAAVANCAYRNADAVVTISQGMQENLLRKGVEPDKLSVIHNWIDTQRVAPIPREENPLFDELALDRDKFYVTYGGNLGYAQGIETILQAAAELADCEDIQFLIWGKGAQEDIYKSMAQELGLKNLRFFAMRPQEEAGLVYSAGDLSVISCKKGAGTTALPSKTWSILSAATMPVACFDRESELRRLIEDNGIGLFVDAEDAAGLAQAIRYACAHREECREMGKRARELVCTSYSRETATAQYIQLFEAVLAGKEAALAGKG